MERKLVPGPTPSASSTARESLECHIAVIFTTIVQPLAAAHPKTLPSYERLVKLASPKYYARSRQPLSCPWELDAVALSRQCLRQPEWKIQTPVHTSLLRKERRNPILRFAFVQLRSSEPLGHDHLQAYNENGGKNEKHQRDESLVRICEFPLCQAPHATNRSMIV